MKAVLLRDARINHKAGETIDVSPAQFDFLVSTGSAKLAEPEKTTERKTRKKE